MARGRLLSRSLGTSRKFHALPSEFAQALYMLLIPNADDFGRLAGDAFTVKHAVWPTSKRTESEFDKALEAMHDAGLVERYEVDGEKYLSIKDFDHHQAGLHKRTASHFPEPPGISRKVPAIPSEQNRTEQKGTEQNRTALRASSRVSVDGFDAFWAVYPKHVGKAAAVKAWGSLAPDAELRARLLEAVTEQRTSDQWTRDGGAYVPNPATWLNGRRWEDELAPARHRATTVPSASDFYRMTAWCDHSPRCGTREGHELRLQRERGDAATEVA